MAGITIPLRAMKHAYIVTEELPGMHAMLPNVRDHDLRIYMTTRGNAMALGGYETNPEFVNVAENFSFGLYDPNWETF
jgi:sarcosine dehydrogenase